MKEVLIWENLLFKQKFEKLKKSDYVPLIGAYSMNVPDVSLRKQWLEQILASKEIDGGLMQDNVQYFLGICISTLKISEISILADLISKSLDLAYSQLGSRTYKFLDYVLARDWGKTFQILAGCDNSHALFYHITQGSYYQKSDEFACLVLRGLGSELGKGLLKNAPLSTSRIFSLLEAVKGRSGGLLREVYFSIRREKITACKVPIPNDDIVAYILASDLSDVNAYAAIMILHRCAEVDFPALVGKVKLVKPEVSKMIATGIGMPFLIWSRMQSSLLISGLKKNNTRALESRTLSDFYNVMIKDYAKSPSQDLFFQDKIGVIITTFEPKIELLESSLSSMIYQSYTNIEVCLVDDCSSSEKSAEIKALVEKLGDNRIKLHRNAKNIGQYASRNYAMELLKGCKYFAIQDDDDVSHPQRFEYQVKAFVDESTYLCMCQQVRFDSQLRYIPDKVNPYEFDFGPVSSMYRSDLIKNIGGFANVRSRGDVEFITRIKRQYGDVAIVKLPVPMYIMRCDLDTVSASKDRYLKTQLDVFRSLMSSEDKRLYKDGQQHALFS